MKSLVLFLGCCLLFSCGGEPAETKKSTSGEDLAETRKSIHNEILELACTYGKAKKAGKKNEMKEIAQKKEDLKRKIAKHWGDTTNTDKMKEINEMNSATKKEMKKCSK